MAQLCLTVTSISSAPGDGWYLEGFDVGSQVTLSETGTDTYSGGGFDLTRPGTNFDLAHPATGTNVGGDTTPEGTYTLSYSGGNMEVSITHGACISTPTNDFAELFITKVKMTFSTFPVRKTLTDGVAASEAFVVGPIMAETVSALDAPPGTGPRLTDAVAAADNTAWALLKEFLTDTVAAADLLTTLYGQGYQDAVAMVEELKVRAEMALTDTVLLTEVLKGGMIPLTEVIAIVESMTISTSFRDFVTLNDAIKLAHTLQETVLGTDAISMQESRGLSDVIDLVSRFYLESLSKMTDEVVADDRLYPGFFYAITDTVAVLDVISMSIAQVYWDQVFANDLLTIEPVTLIMGCEVDLVSNRRSLTLSTYSPEFEFTTSGELTLFRC